MSVHQMGGFDAEKAIRRYPLGFIERYAKNGFEEHF
jgi:hypothetical protein